MRVKRRCSQQSIDTGTHYSDSELASLYSYSLMLSNEHLFVCGITQTVIDSLHLPHSQLNTLIVTLPGRFFSWNYHSRFLNSQLCLLNHDFLYTCIVDIDNTSVTKRVFELDNVTLNSKVLWYFALTVSNHTCVIKI